MTTPNDSDIEYLGTWPAEEPGQLTGVELVLEGYTAGSRDSETKVFSRESTIAIGRTPSSDPMYQDDFSHERADYFCPVMSRKHASISFIGSQTYLKDTQSHHGTFLTRNGHKSKLEPDAKVLLADGDRITFGKLVHKNGKEHSPITVRVKLLTMPVLPSTSGRYGLRSISDDEDDEDEDDESEDMEIDGVAEQEAQGSRPPGAWPSDTQECINQHFFSTKQPSPGSHEEPMDDFPDVLPSHQGTDTPEQQPSSSGSSPRRINIERDQGNEEATLPRQRGAISKLKLEVAKLQQHKKKMKMRLDSLECNVSRINDLEDRVEADMQHLQQVLEGRLERQLIPLEDRISYLEDRDPIESPNPLVDPFGQQDTLAVEVTSKLEEANAEAAAAKESIKDLVEELSHARIQAEKEISKHVESIQAVKDDLLQRKRRRESDNTVQESESMSPRKRMRLGNTAFAIFGVAALWTGLAYY